MRSQQKPLTPLGVDLNMFSALLVNFSMKRDVPWISEKILKIPNFEHKMRIFLGFPME